MSRPKKAQDDSVDAGEGNSDVAPKADPFSPLLYFCGYS